MRKIIFFITVLFASKALLLANVKVSFKAIAPETVVVGDQFRLSYTVNSLNVRDFRIASVKGFEVLMGPSRSQQSSTQIVNGTAASSNSITFTYILMANNEGIFSIPGASITAEGNPIISNSVRIKVLPTGKKTSNTNAPVQDSKSISAKSVSNNDLFITATVSKSNVYEQEAFLLTYKIYTVVDLRNFSNVKLPDFKGFHSQEIELPSNAKWALEHYNGKNYHTTIYRQFVLFPQQSGKLIIESARFDASIAKTVQSVDPFDAFFNGGSNYVEIKKSIITPRITVNVYSLPPKKPVDFSGGVGTFSISSSISNTKIKTNDAVTVKVVISGIGNHKLISSPTIKFPDDFEVYDPKVDNKVKLTKDGLSGSKVIEYLAIPRNPGVFKIPAISFSFFDVKNKVYKNISTKEFNLEVEKGVGNADQVIANFTNKEDLKILGEDIRYIKLGDAKIISGSSFFFGSLTYWLCYIIPIFIFGIVFLISKKQIVENSNIAKVRNKKANKIALRRMKLAQTLLRDDNKDLFYDEVLKALWGYISDKLNIPVSRLSKDNVEERLNKYGVPNELIREFIDTLNECEFARYSPSDKNRAMDNLYVSAVSVITKIENLIKK